MAMYGIGAFFNKKTDVSGNFIQGNFVGTGWGVHDAPDIHEFFKSLKKGDIVYIKSYPIAKKQERKLFVKAIGKVKDNTLLNTASTNNLIQIGRNVEWIYTKHFSISHIREKNNVRNNTLYQEYNPKVRAVILDKIKQAKASIV